MTVGLPHVLWIGGPPGSGKTSIARMLAAKHDLRACHADAHTWEHHDRAVARGYRGATRWEQMTPDEQWLGQVDEMVGISVDANEERFRLIVEEIEKLPRSPLVLAEGTPLLPWLIRTRVSSAAHAVWLVPTPEFQRSLLERRPQTTFERTSNPARAASNRIEREIRVGAMIEYDAGERGGHVLKVDGSRDLRAMADAVEAIFESAITAGPRAETKEERRKLRRDGNLTLLRQVATYFERVPGAGDAATSPVPFACECGASGCDGSVEMSLAAAGDAFQGRYVVSNDHASHRPA